MVLCVTAALVAGCYESHLRGDSPDIDAGPDVDAEREDAGRERDAGEPADGGPDAFDDTGDGTRIGIEKRAVVCGPGTGCVGGRVLARPVIEDETWGMVQHCTAIAGVLAPLLQED